MPLACQNNIPPPPYGNNGNLRPLAIHANTEPFLGLEPRTPPPVPDNVHVIDPQRRCHSVGPACSDSAVKVVDIFPPFHKRSHSHGGSVRLERKRLFGDGPVNVERRQRFIESPSPQRQIEFVHIRKPSCSRSRPARQLEWVQKRHSSSPSYARSRSRSRPVVRDRIIEVVEERDRSPSPAPVLLIENEDRNRFDPFEYNVEDYYEPVRRGRAYQEIIIDEPHRNRSTGKARSRSYTRRRPSPSAATSSLRSMGSISRQSIHSLERSVSRSVSSSPKSEVLDSETASVSTTTTTISRPSSSCSSADPKSPSALSKVKFRYTPTADNKAALNAYNRVKVFRGRDRKQHDDSEGEEKAKDKEEDEGDDKELKRLRRLLKLAEHTAGRNKNVSHSRARSTSRGVSGARGARLGVRT